MALSASREPTTFSSFSGKDCGVHTQDIHGPYSGRKNGHKNSAAVVGPFLAGMKGACLVGQEREFF